MAIYQAPVKGWIKEVKKRIEDPDIGEIEVSVFQAVVATEIKNFKRYEDAENWRRQKADELARKQMIERDGAELERLVKHYLNGMKITAIDYVDLDPKLVAALREAVQVLEKAIAA